MDPNTNEYKWLVQDIDLVLKILDKPWDGRGGYTQRTNKVSTIVKRLKLSMNKENSVTGPCNLKIN